MAASCSKNVINEPSNDSSSSSSDSHAVSALLSAFRLGAPPFLRRNLSYIHKHKSDINNDIFDLNWTHPSHRSAHGQRHLKIIVNSSNCIISPRFNLRLGGQSNVCLLGCLQLSLLIEQSDGRKLSFSGRRSDIRIWRDTEHPDPHIRDDLSLNTSFDFSSFKQLLTSPVTQLSIIIHISSFRDPSSSSADMRNASHESIGIVVLSKQGCSKHGTALSNQIITVPLTTTNCNNNNTNIMSLDNINVPSQNKAKTMYIGEKIDYSSVHSSIRLRIDGQVEHSIKSILHANNNNSNIEDKPRILVTVKYDSIGIKWDGIVRHDFICPWCHRNCYRFRSLIYHLQLDHNNLKFSLNGMESSNHLLENRSSAPFTVSLQVTPVHTNGKATKQFSMVRNNNVSNAARSTSGTESEDYEEDNFINPGCFPSLYAARRAHESKDIENGLNHVSLDITPCNDNSSDSTCTLYENEQHAFDPSSSSSTSTTSASLNFPNIIRRNLWIFCYHCGRRHDRSYRKHNFCSEWCETTYARENDSSSSRNSKNLVSTTKRDKKINYKEAFGKLQLFHIVSVSEMKEEHFDEDDPDSEEEVDQSWRLDLNIERIRQVEDASAKEKVLWLLWNKFAHDNYPIPCLYGERYTRYTLELFVLDHKTQIINLKLRTQLFGFLKAMHVHGLIDSRAIISVMECLDGKKKRRDIAISARPELPLERNKNNNNGSNQSSKRRNSNSRRKNNNVVV